MTIFAGAISTTNADRAAQAAYAAAKGRRDDTRPDGEQILRKAASGKQLTLDEIAALMDNLGLFIGWHLSRRRNSLVWKLYEPFQRAARP